MEDLPKTLMDKTIDELTMRDTLKINLVVVAACVAIPMVFVGVVSGADAAWNKFKNHRKNRKTETLTA